MHQEGSQEGRGLLSLCKTYEIRVTENGVKKFEYPKILSRGKDIMPVVEKVFAN